MRPHLFMLTAIAMLLATANANAACVGNGIYQDACTGRYVGKGAYVPDVAGATLALTGFETDARGANWYITGVSIANEGGAAITSVRIECFGMGMRGAEIERLATDVKVAIPAGAAQSFKSIDVGAAKAFSLLELSCRIASAERAQQVVTATISPRPSHYNEQAYVDARIAHKAQLRTVTLASILSMKPVDRIALADGLLEHGGALRKRAALLANCLSSEARSSTDRAQSIETAFDRCLDLLSKQQKAPPRS